MEEETKRNLKKIAEETEIKVTRSLLRWKYKKEGKTVRLDYQLEDESRQVASRLHQVIAKRGKNAWMEVKKAYFKGDKKREDPIR